MISKAFIVLRVGLTGGIGCGKSAAIHLFKQYGVPIIDADQIAKKLVQPGQPALNEIADYFGRRYIQQDGSLNRALLKEKVFTDSHLLNQLELILHPRIRRSIIHKMNRIAFKVKQEPKSGVEFPPYLIADIPLLVEKGYQDLFDEIVVVDCTESQQFQRVLARDQLDLEAIKSIVSKQASRNERLEIATKTLDNSGSVEALALQVEALHQVFRH